MQKTKLSPKGWLPLLPPKGWIPPPKGRIQREMNGEAQSGRPTNTSLPYIPEGLKQFQVDNIYVTTNSAQLTQENRRTSIVSPRLSEGWKQFLAHNIDVTTKSSQPRHGTHSGGLNREERLREATYLLKRTRYELESNRSQARQNQLV